MSRDDLRAPSLPHSYQRERLSSFCLGAWRQYFDSRYSTYTPTRSEAAAMRKGRADISRGQFVTLNQLLHDLDTARRKARPKTTRQSSR